MSQIFKRIQAKRCERRGHDWFGRSVSEYVASTAICLRCGVFDYALPWGECLGGHPLAEHYRVDEEGLVVGAAGTCQQPQ